jgi:hypothetical protein
MPFPDFAHCLGWLSARLKEKHYTTIGAPAPLQAGFFKLGALNLPYAIGVKNAMATTDSPAQVYQMTAEWFHSMIGRTGGGLLIFVCHDPTARAVEEMKKAAEGAVVSGHYDILTDSDSIPNNLGWRDEILSK